MLPGLWDMHVHLMINGHSDYAHWDKTYPDAVRAGHHAGVGEAAPDGRRHERSRPRRAARRQSSQFAMRSTGGRFLARRCTSRVRSFSTLRIQARSCSAGGSTARRTPARKCAKLADAGVNVIKLIDQDQMTMDEVLRRRRRGAQAGAARDGALASPRGDPARTRRRCRLLRAHGPGEPRPSIPRTWSRRSASERRR